MKNCEKIACLALAGLTLAPLFVRVNPNLNVILTACLTVYVGCFRSVKDSPPTDTISKEEAMSCALVDSALLLSLFLLLKFLSKDLVNAALTAYFFVYGISVLSAALLPAIRRFLPNPWNDNLIVWSFPYRLEFTKSQIIAGIPATFFCAWYAWKKHWLANNILCISFAIQGIETRYLGSFKTGVILLVGEFYYDVFWVFFIPIMVTVAKSLDCPVKFLFPTGDALRPYAMLGVGDIITPGIFVALALRFDVSRGNPQYFTSTFVGYVTGVVLTVIVRNLFQAPQPALLYIVPAVIGFLGSHIIWNDDILLLMAFDESESSEGEDESESSEGEVYRTHEE